MIRTRCIVIFICNAPSPCSVSLDHCCTFTTLSVIVQCFRISESWFDSSGLITRMICEDTIIKARKRKSLSGRRYWRNFKIFTQAHSLGEWVGHTFVVVYIRACSNSVHSETTFNGIQGDPGVLLWTSIYAARHCFSLLSRLTYNRWVDQRAQRVSQSQSGLVYVMCGTLRISRHLRSITPSPLFTSENCIVPIVFT